MIKPIRYRSCVEALRIYPDEVVSIVGAGGKTSLLFLLAQELKVSGQKVLITTTTKMKMPTPHQIDSIDLGNKVFSTTTLSSPGIYFAVEPCDEIGKVGAVNCEHLQGQVRRFNITLIEADGAAMKPLKGWNATEPVVPEFTTMTIGVVDISTLGKVIDEKLVHRLELFVKITFSKQGDLVSFQHLIRLINHSDGLFKNARGRKVLYINKVESPDDLHNAGLLRDQFNGTVVAGDIHSEVWFAWPG